MHDWRIYKTKEISWIIAGMGQARVYAFWGRVLFSAHWESI
jgi:hypothetical protein